MNRRNFELIDSNRTPLAVGVVDFDEEGDLFSGEIDLGRTPEEIRSVFVEFEEIVEGQIFSLLDEIEAKVSALSLRVRLDDGTAHVVRDLQVYPSTGSVSFRPARLATTRRTVISNGPASADRSAQTGTRSA